MAEQRRETKAELPIPARRKGQREKKRGLGHKERVQEPPREHIWSRESQISIKCILGILGYKVVRLV